MIKRRLEDRFLCADLVELDWRAGENGMRTAEAVLEDISARGACVQVEEPIPVGAEISILGHAGPGFSPGVQTGTRFFGHVSYCEYREYGYFVGIRLSDQTRWSSGVFAPQHLTNLAALSQGEEAVSQPASPEESFPN